MSGSDRYLPGERVVHPDFGQGVVVESVRAGYLRIFFATGERRVPLASLRRELSRIERILANVAGSAERLRTAWLCYEAHVLPMMESASALTSARIDLLLEVPKWDLVVFDEAHHLTAYRSGTKVTRTDNYKLAEALKTRTRDLIFLSATPQQGNHFQFWMLIQLLNPTLFNSVDEMSENRYRLNSVVVRRTKADACRPDGTPLFARRWVHTESFLMNQVEHHFYHKLREYLEDGFDMAQRQGNQGRALGFLMAIFQKIAASSFAAVGRTLRRRLLMLTISEGIVRDRELDIEGRERLYTEARELIHQEFGLPLDAIGRSEADRTLADCTYRLVKRFEAEELERASDPYGTEYASTHAEEIAAGMVNLHLPEERQRIREVLSVFPSGRETKVQKLLDGLGVLWRQNSDEKVVVFATYLGTVDLLAREIESVYPGQGVVVLRGGDHGAKVAAERRFKRVDGPRVLVCTAAGREGINLQYSHICPCSNISACRRDSIASCTSS
jgi:hypothetical protein